MFKAARLVRCARGVATQARPQLYFFARVTPPLGLFSLLKRLAPSASTVEAELRHAIPDSVAAVTSVDVLPAEGGVLVSFDVKDEVELARVAADGYARRWLLFGRHPRGFRVLGRPFLTDIPHKIGRHVAVDPALREEDVYALFRPYGRLAAVETGSATFARLGDACAAVVCTHRLLRAGNEIRVRQVLGPSFVHKVYSWLADHPRVTLPVLLALIFTLAYTVFEPVRQLGVETKVGGALQQYLAWAQAKTSFIARSIGLNDEKKAAKVGDGLAEQATQLKRELGEGLQTFVVLEGPKGSGKSEILAAITRELAQPTLIIDCNALRSSDPHATVRGLARAVGYWPLFMWTNSVLKACELGVSSLTGQQTKLTRSFDEQVSDVLGTVANALRRLATRPLGKHSAEEEIVFLQMHPELRPLVVIEGFMSTDPLSVQLAKWSAGLISQNVARVVVSTSDSSFEKALAQALPNKMLSTIHISDASPIVSKQYVYDQFIPLAETDAARTALAQLLRTQTEFLSPLGGRMTDLQAYGRRLLAGETPQDALAKLIRSAAAEVSQLFLTPSNVWTPQQTWTLVLKLSAQPQDAEWLSVQGQLLGKLGFKTEDELQSALEALKEADLISARTVGGRIVGVKASKPLYAHAFRAIAADPLLRPLMDAKVAQAQLDAQNTRIAALEKEMQLFAPLAPTGLPKELRERFSYLADQLGIAQHGVEAAESQLAQCRQRLSKFGWYALASASSSFE